jgi:hypothetical protein
MNMIRLIAFASSLLFIISCKKESTLYNFPAINCASNISVYEDDPGGNAKITLSTANPIEKTVIVYYSTSDSSAQSGQDFQGITNGKVQINRGTQSSSIEIPIYSDTLHKLDLVFKVHIDSIINGSMQNRNIRVKIINVDYSNLVWSDEFNDSTINISNWNFELGNNGGWCNAELEVYTDSRSNAYISNGNLIIKAINSGAVYTSARMTTQHKDTFITGRIDIRAKLPQGKGIWPALWMLGSNISTDGWPKCGEIDIMELLGDNPNKAYGTVHYLNGTHQSSGSIHVLSSGSFSDSYHIFSLIWQPHHLKWLIDNEIYYSVASNQIDGFAFDLPQFFIFNIAVGGNWPGNPDSTTVFPQTMSVDYIRVYQ